MKTSRALCISGKPQQHSFAVVFLSLLKLCLLGHKATSLLWQDPGEKSPYLRLGGRVY